MSDPIINVKNLEITDHAYRRIKERLNYTGDKKAALNYCKGILGSDNTKYVCVTTCDLGNDSHLFSNGRIAFHLSMDLKRIVTVIDLTDKIGHYSKLKNEIKSIYFKELKNIEKQELIKSKKLEYEKIIENVNIAPIRLRQYKSRYKTVKEKCEHDIFTLSIGSRNLENELKEIQANKRAIARALATVVV